MSEEDEILEKLILLIDTGERLNIDLALESAKGLGNESKLWSYMQRLASSTSIYNENGQLSCSN